MKFILGTKEYMTQIFGENGKVAAATVLRVEPGVISQVKTAEKDGYAAVQVAQGTQKESRVSKAVRGHLKGAYKHVREFRPRSIDAISDATTGTEIGAGAFSAGDIVTVSAISKGKGFQGVVKRHGFAGDKASHGRKHSMRTPGSIGGGGRAGGRVIKGMRMAGRMGGERVTVRGLKILQVDPTNHLLVISGAVPGRKGTLVEVEGA